MLAPLQEVKGTDTNVGMVGMLEKQLDALAVNAPAKACPHLFFSAIDEYAAPTRPACASALQDHSASSHASHSESHEL